MYVCISLTVKTINAIIFLIIKTDPILSNAHLFVFPSTLGSMLFSIAKSSITPNSEVSCHYLSSPMIHSHIWQWKKAVALGNFTLSSKLIPLLFHINTMFCTSTRAIASRLYWGWNCGKIYFVINMIARHKLCHFEIFTFNVGTLLMIDCAMWHQPVLDPIL